MKVKTYRSIAEVDESAWDSIVERGGIFSSYKYIESLERSGLNKGRCYYPVVYDDNGKIAAHACAYLVDTEIDIFAQGVIKKLILFIRRYLPNFFMLRSLECGTPIALGNTISFRACQDSPKALAELCNGIEKLAKELKVKFVLFRDFYSDESAFCDILRTRGYGKIHNLPKASLKIRWKSFDEYLNSMRSSYRCKLIKGMDKCARAKVSIQILKEPEKYSSDLKRLYDNVSRQAKEIKREQLPEDYFRDVNKYLGGKITILSAVRDNKLIGFMLTLLNDKELISAMIGLDYDCNREYCIYFNLFYETIKLAIDNGITEIDMGITALDPKRDMGSDIVDLKMYMKHSNPLLNRVIPTVFDMIAPPDTTMPRNVFK